jgi:hypothetical protein
VAFYGPTEDRASKIAVGIVLSDGDDPSIMERWLTDETDARRDPEILAAVQEFLLRHQVKSVVMSDGLLGCPHEEGVDYPEGQSCPQCPYWAGRDRFTGEKAP